MGPLYRSFIFGGGGSGGYITLHRLIYSFHVVILKLTANILNPVLMNAVTATLSNFVKLFRKAHEENCKQAEMEKKKAEKEAEMEKAKGINLTKKATK